MAKGSATWKRVKFGEIAQCVNDRVDDPKAAGVDRYVGLEHLDPESLSIRRWGTPDDVESTKLRFKPGDIIFGKRRAYQRKLAVADFEGICSAHAMVLRAKPDAVFPDFLPFFMQSDLFMERAIAISVGSLSPTINWKTLAAEEFTLPPLEEQRRATKALASVSVLLDQLADVLAAHRTMSQAQSLSLLSGAAQRNAPSTTLMNVCKRIGVGIASSASHAYRSTGIPFIRNTNISAGRIDTAEMLFVDPAYAEQHRTKRVFKGDVVMTRTATDVPGDAAVVPPELDGAQAFTILVCTPDQKVLDSDYLCRWINGAPGRAFIRTRRGGAKQQNLGATFLAEMPIKLPSLSQQRVLVEQLQQTDAAGQLIIGRIEAARRLAKTLQNDALGQ